jgi:hypothetical protein
MQKKKRVRLERRARPERSVYHEARERVGYYSSAVRSTNLLSLLAAEVREIDNPFLTLGNAFENGLEEPGLTEIVRYEDLSRVRGFRAEEIDRDPLKIDYTKDPDDMTKEYIRCVLGELTIRDIRQTVEDALTDQQSRRDYWHDRAEESMLFKYGRKIAKRALLKYDHTPQWVD